MRTIFRCQFVQSLRFGHALFIGGKTCEGAEKFNISLSNLYLNNYLSIDFDFHSDTITLKQFHNEIWHSEKSLDCEYSNFLNEFTIYVLIGHEQFHFSLNEEMNFSYEVDLPQKLFNILEIKGDFDYIRQMDHRQYFPRIWPPIQIVERRLHFSHDIPMPFETGHIMVISVHLEGNKRGRFILHLENIWENERKEVIWSVQFDTRVIVWTSKTIEEDEEHYGFDEEETISHFPFPSFFQPFKLAIGFAKHGVKFSKDGAFLFTFVNRSADVLPTIGGLKIFGTDGAIVNVSEVRHFYMDDAFCIGFEKYSKL